MIVFYCDQHEIALPPGHRFPIRKYRMLRERLSQDTRFELRPAPFADRETVTLAHDPEYVDRVLAGTADMRRIGFPWSEGLVRRTLASLGGTLAATMEALESGVAGTLAGGTHHAFRSEGAGYCVFNDVAVAIHRLRKDGVVRRAGAIDLDVHQGDGTAHFFEADRQVFTLSMHGKNNFPFRKQRSRLDIELADGTGDAEYLEKLERALGVVGDFGPEMVFYLSGVDALEADRLGRLALSLEGLKERDRCVMQAVKRWGVPLAITLGGGYAEPIELTVEAHANTFQTAAEMFARL